MPANRLLLSDLEYQRKWLENFMEKSKFDFKMLHYSENDVSSFDRVYVGEEFCDTYFLRYLATIEENIKYLSSIQKPFSIILPVLSEVHFPRIVAFLDSIQRYFTEQTEVVCNDPGSMAVFAEKGLTIVSGRYLTRLLMGTLVKSEDDLRKYPLNWIKRVEIDSLSLKYLPKLSCPNISLYENYVSFCLLNNRCAFRKLTDTYPENRLCNFGCDTGSVALQNKYSDIDFILYRNTILQARAAAGDLSRINRIIYTSI